jgi:hypothetical protein
MTFLTTKNARQHLPDFSVAALQRPHHGAGKRKQCSGMHRTGCRSLKGKQAFAAAEPRCAVNRRTELASQQRAGDVGLIERSQTVWPTMAARSGRRHVSDQIEASRPPDPFRVLVQSKQLARILGQRHWSPRVLGLSLALGREAEACGVYGSSAGAAREAVSTLWAYTAPIRWA